MAPDHERAAQWFDQALRCLAGARSARQGGSHLWACIQAEQAAEKALVALYAGRGLAPWGLDLSQLLRGLPHDLTVPANLVQSAQALDRCLAAGPGNGNGSSPPDNWWGPEHSALAIGCAADTAAFVRRWLDEAAVRAATAARRNPEGALNRL